MILDILIIAIVLICSFLGFKKGFAYTFIHTAGLIMSAILAFILTDKCKTLLETIPFMQQHIPQYPTSEKIPELLEGTFLCFTHEIVLSIITFLLLFIVIKLILSLFLFVYTKSIRDGFTGFIDGTLGLALGMLKGVIIVYIILLVCIPIAETLMPNMVNTINGILNSSQLADDLYNNNPFILLLQSSFLN